MEPESSLPLTQHPSTAPYPELHHSSPRHSFFVKVYFNIILPHKHRSSKWSLSFRFPTNILYSPRLYSVCSTCTLHLINRDLIKQAAQDICTLFSTGVLISPQPDQEGNKLQRQKILMYIYPICNHNWRNISTIYIYIYIYNKTSIKRNILTIKQNTSGSRSG